MVIKKRHLFLVLIMCIFTGVLSSGEKKKFKLSDFQATKVEDLEVDNSYQRRVNRSPASVDSEKVRIGGICVASNGQVLYPSDSDYADCLNSENQGKYGSYKNSGKGLFILITP